MASAPATRDTEQANPKNVPRLLFFRKRFRSEFSRDFREDECASAQHRHKDYCSKLCVEDAIDVEAQVHGIHAATNDSHGRDLVGWSFTRLKGESDA
jgi:hypothetical protein